MTVKRPTITDDAAGITQPAKERTGSVVEQLLAAPPAGDAALVDLPTERIHNHPRNRRILDEDVADIVAGLKAGEPILNPLGVTAAADWNAGKPDDLAEIPPGDYMITAGGHRRLRAAELAGLKTVPCIVRATFAGGAGRRAALLENVQRKDLDVFEQAEAIAELVAEPYKMSQRDIAKMLDCNQSHVAKRLKLLKLPSTVRESVRLGKLPISDALELAGVVEHKAVFDLALEKIRQWRYDGKRAVQAAQGEYDAQKRYEAESAKLTEAGVTVVDRWPSYSGSTSSREPVRLDGLGITTAKHKKEPCHGAHLQTSAHTEKAQITYCCTDPRRHAAKGASKVKSTKTSTSSSSSDAEKEQKKRRAELRKTVNPARLAIVRQLYSGGGFDADTRRELIQQSVIRRLLSGGYSAPSTEVAVDLLDIRPANERAYLAGVLTEHAKTVKPDALALVGALVHFETRLHENRYSWDADDRWYLELLARNGYVVTATEHAMLGDQQAEDGTWQPRAVEDVAEDPTCRVCQQYLDSLPAGVTAVGEDLCSACSDATDAGWVADESVPIVATSTTACMECEHVEPDVGCSCEYCYCGTAAADVDQDHEQLLEASAAVG